MQASSARVLRNITSGSHKFKRGRLGSKLQLQMWAEILLRLPLLAGSEEQRQHSFREAYEVE